MNIIIYGTDEQRIAHFRARMDNEFPGSENYEKARKILAWLCAKFRAKDKINSEQYR